MTVTTTLNAADKTAIGGLARSNMAVTAGGLKRFISRAMWIGKTNHYAHDVVARLQAHAPATPVQERNLAQYIAASVVLHANDGWSYLGRSVACLLSGDIHRALHLAYYAELRSAMSLLAGAGIGVFNNKHYIVSTANATNRLDYNRGTHLLAWLALEEWSQQAASGALFASLVRPEGKTLDDWFQPIGGASSLAPQAKAWFMQWGMDLNLATKDRDARNESSYRPDGVPTTWELSAKEGLKFVRDMWSNLEPSASSSFEQIDRHILRLALERYYLGFSGNVARADDPGYRRIVSRVISAQSLARPTEERLERFLLRQSAPADPLVFSYSSVSPGAPQTDALAVMSRAVLLLRIATGSARDLLFQAGIDLATLTFWSNKIGESRGLWKPGAAPSELSDLWADIDDGLREADELEAASSTSFDTVNDVIYGYGKVNLLASHERVSLWGLCTI